MQEELSLKQVEHENVEETKMNNESHEFHENVSNDDEDEYLKRTSRKIKTIYLKAKKLI